MRLFRRIGKNCGTGQRFTEEPKPQVVLALNPLLASGKLEELNRPFDNVGIQTVLPISSHRICRICLTLDSLRIRIGTLWDDMAPRHHWPTLADEVLQDLLRFWHILAIASHQVAKRILGLFPGPRPQLCQQAEDEPVSCRGLHAVLVIATGITGLSQVVKVISVGQLVKAIAQGVWHQLGYSLEPIGYLFRRIVPFHSFNRSQALQAKYLSRSVIPQFIPKAPDHLCFLGLSFDGTLCQAVWRWYSPDSCPQKGVVIQLQTG